MGGIISKKDEEIIALRMQVQNLHNQFTSIGIQYNRVLERLKEVNTINKQWEQSYNEMKSQAESAMQDIDRERRGLFHELKGTQSKIEALEDELKAKNDELHALKQNGDGNKNRYAIISQDNIINIPKNSEVGGNLKTTKNITIGDSAVIQGEIEGSGIIVGANCRVMGMINAKDFLKIGRKTEVTGDINAGGEVVVDAECKVKRIHSDGRVTVGEKCSVDHVSASGNVDLKQGTVVKDGIEYMGAINIGEHVSIDGMIKRKQAPNGGKQSSQQTAPPPPDDEDDDSRRCDKCGAILAEDEITCPHCTTKQVAPQHPPHTSQKKSR